MLLKGMNSGCWFPESRRRLPLVGKSLCRRRASMWEENPPCLFQTSQLFGLVCSIIVVTLHALKVVRPLLSLGVSVAIGRSAAICCHPCASQEVYSFDHPPLHDPCAVAYVISPQLFQVPAPQASWPVIWPLVSGKAADSRQTAVLVAIGQIRDLARVRLLLGRL